MTNSNSKNRYAGTGYLVIALFLVCEIHLPDALAQVNYKVGGKQATITLTGTSTLHNWKMTAHAFTSDAQFAISPDNKITALSSIAFTLPVTNLKSESGGLNDNAYKALKSDTYKNITFVMTQAKITSSSGKTYKITVWGNLTIGGVTKPVGLYLTAKYGTDGSISCSGSLGLKMSTFNIERPSFLLGAMKAGDALTLKYALTLIQ
jgi:polyisoprenoid-binding protein YceI